MANSKTNQQKIEQYLRNQLSEAEKVTFQTEMLFDKDLRKEVKQMRQLQKIVLSEKRGHQENEQQSNLIKWFLVLLFFSSIIGYFIITTKNPSPQSSPNHQLNEEAIFEDIEQDKVPEKASNLDLNASPSSNTPNHSTPKSQSKTNKEQEDAKASKTVKKNPKPIIYAANFTPNPLLEAEISSNLRGDYSFTLQSPQAEENYLLKGGKITWTLKGNLATDKLPGEDFSLIIEIYSNKIGTYENGNPIVQFPLQLSPPKDDYYEFLSKHIFEMKPKLYYFLIRNDLTGAILKGGKFSVQ